MNTVSGTFEVDITAGEGDPAGPVARMVVDKRYSGGLEGTGVGQMLAVHTPVAGSSTYVALETVTGSIRGRTGTFALRHDGVMIRNQGNLTITVVPDSGTADFAGIDGTMDIVNNAGAHGYTFTYTLPEP